MINSFNVFTVFSYCKFHYLTLSNVSMMARVMNKKLLEMDHWILLLIGFGAMRVLVQIFRNLLYHYGDCME